MNENYTTAHGGVSGSFHYPAADYEIRRHALHMALEARLAGEPDSETTARAKAFEAYLRGDLKAEA